MKFCNKCGAKLSGSEKFCNKCGAPLNIAARITNDNFTQTNKEEVTTNKETGTTPVKPQMPKVTQAKPMSKRTKLIGISAISVLLIIFGVRYFLNDYYSAEKVVTRFLDAIDNNDSNALQSLVISADSSATIDEPSMKSFLELLKSDKELLKTTNRDLSNDVKDASELLHKESIELLEDDELAALTIKSKNFFFTKYAIIVEPNPIYVTSNSLEATIYISDKEHGTITSEDEQKLVGYFIPGIYEITLKSKDLFENEITDTLKFASVYSDYENTSNFFEDYSIYHFDTNVPKATVFLNGNSLEMTAQDFEDGIGPLSLDDSIYLSYTVSGKEYKTKEVTPKDYSSYIDVDFSYSDYRVIDKYLSEQTQKEDAANSAQAFIDKYNDKEYIITDSNTRTLGFKDLNNYNVEELYIARNEMLARHGYVFTDYPVLQKYFESKPWYKANASFTGELTNQTEIDNFTNLKTIEFLLISKENCSPVVTDYVFPKSNTETLSSYQVSSLSDWELIIARNEIFARYGLEFSTINLLEHFKSKSWFKINTSTGNDVGLSEVERKNVQTILDEEKKRMEKVLNYDLGEQ